jgi:caffeoyl-CoA O-methyltransferase
MEIIDPVASDYVLSHTTSADEVRRELIAATRAATGDAAGMRVSPDEGALLTMLTRLVGARLAGVADVIDLRIAPAIETLRALPAEPAIGLTGGPRRPRSGRTRTSTSGSSPRPCPSVARR